jgi:hypothetical protein
MIPFTPDKLHTSKGKWNHRFPDSEAVLWIYFTADVKFFAGKKEPRLSQFRIRGKGKISLRLQLARYYTHRSPTPNNS